MDRTTSDNVVRCNWVSKGGPEEIRYHDEEWGVPVYDDQVLFECITLEGAQAGLSWKTILLKREGYRAAFSGFDPEKVARFTDKRQLKLLENPAIIRNKLKVASTITNAQAFLEVANEFNSFSNYLWDFAGGEPIKNGWENSSQVPASTPLSDKLSKDLKKRGFRFVGTTICYSFLQATGVINDHLVTCFRYDQV